MSYIQVLGFLLLDLRFHVEFACTFLVLLALAPCLLAVLNGLIALSRRLLALKSFCLQVVTFYPFKTPLFGQLNKK